MDSCGENAVVKQDVSNFLKTSLTLYACACMMILAVLNAYAFILKESEILS
ncbi:hypothetical protein JCM31185_07900 [Furfurilactobacillus curtus]|uniref:Uncharacterized protein n=1 Tax=Furfurilactobacillus curtus TaxID=1746200 RepID=A0ABQ5JQW0_9LACO